MTQPPAVVAVKGCERCPFKRRRWHEHHRHGEYACSLNGEPIDSYGQGPASHCPLRNGPVVVELEGA